jgi:hypothetical protein
MTALYDSLRAANLAVSLLLAAAMLARGAAFLRAPVASKYGRLALFAWVTSTAYGTGEAMAQSATAGPRVPTVTSVLCITAAWVCAEVKYDRRERARLAELAAARRPLLPEQVADLGDGLGEGAHLGEGLPGGGIRGQHVAVGVVGVGPGAARQR